MQMNGSLMKKTAGVLLLASVLGTGGCASWVGMEADPSDPLEPFNRSMFALNQHIDTYIAKPVAEEYQKIVPEPIDRGVTNFFNNLDEIPHATNNLLQLKGRAALSDLGRFLVNSTLGFLGFMDVASSWGMEKHDEDFGQTFGYWGAPSGPFLVLPIIGPSSLRDGAGFMVDWYTHPIWRWVGDNQVGWSLRIVEYVDERSDRLRAEKALRSAAGLDPYLFFRDSYLQHRRYQVYDGNPPPVSDDADDDLE